MKKEIKNNEQINRSWSINHCCSYIHVSGTAGGGNKKIIMKEKKEMEDKIKELVEGIIKDAKELGADVKVVEINGQKNKYKYIHLNF